MPLAKGSSQKVIGKNIKKLMEEDYPQKRAVAISLSEARRSGGQKKKKLKLRKKSGG